MAQLTKEQVQAVGDAVNILQQGMTKRIDSVHGFSAYIIPSKNPDKYVIRIDIKVDKNNERV